MRHWLLGISLVLAFFTSAPVTAAAPRVSVSFPPAMSEEPLTGRLLLIFSPDGRG